MKRLWAIVSTVLSASWWLTLAWLAWRGRAFTVSGMLVGAQYALTAGRLVWRAEAQRTATGFWPLFTWASAVLPLALRPQPALFHPLAGLGLQWMGLALTLWALASLGRAFGLAPADRGLVVAGPYRWIRHPAYLGELLALSGFVWANPSIWNVAVLALIAVALIARLRAEEGLLSAYAEYAARVPWRLCPRVW